MLLNLCRYYFQRRTLKKHYRQIFTVKLYIYIYIYIYINTVNIYVYVYAN